MLEHITSLKNPKVTTWKSLKDRKGRRETGCVLVEGRKMVVEALASAVPVEAVLVDDARLAEFRLPEGITVYTMPGHVLAAVCDTKTPQGIAAVVRMAEVELRGQRLVAMDGVQDPGNVGTIIRTADAAGFDGVILSSQCADVFSPKVLRATMGSVFRMGIRVTDDLLKNFNGRVLRVDKRKRIAEVEITLVGTVNRVWLGLDMMEPAPEAEEDTTPQPEIGNDFKE